MSVINLHLGDCMKALEGMEDNQFDLAIVDPPYGINITKQFEGVKKEGGKSIFKNMKGIVKREWDKNTPTEEYFEKLKKVSKNQIIWGGNYFLNYLGSTKCMLIWNKMNGTNDMADAEIAWTSLNKAVRMFSLHHFSKNYDFKIHLTQKPTYLYKWILKNYANQGDTILDTHGGSMSIAIACGEMGFNLDLWELDEEYFEAGVNRVKKHFEQLSIAYEKPIINIIK